MVKHAGWKIVPPHFVQELRGQYGKLAILSLVEQKESSHERPLGLAYERMVQEVLRILHTTLTVLLRLPSSLAPAPHTSSERLLIFVGQAKKELEEDVVFIPFDFHNICGKLAFRCLRTRCKPMCC